MSEVFKNSYKVAERGMVSLSVYNVGYQRCESGHQWGPGVRDHFLIHCVVSGRGAYVSGKRKYELGAGDLFLVYPYSEVTYRADDAEPWEYCWVGFSGTDAGAILESTDFTAENPVIRSSASETEMRDRLLRIYASRGNGFADAVKMTGELYIALSSLVAAASREEPVRRANLSHVEKGLAYIESHYSWPISVDDVASYVGVSRSQLFREFKANVGKSPKEYLSERRIRHSCALLRETGLSVSAIATSVGYDNGMYYAKVFRAAKGMTPSEYRALGAAKAASET